MPMLSAATAASRVDAIIKPMTAMANKLEVEIDRINFDTQRLENQKAEIDAIISENEAAASRAKSMLGKFKDILA